MIYIHEAHASDAWQMAANARDNVIFATPRTAEERTEVAGACVRKLGIRIPALIDGQNDGVESAYTGWPDRLYVIGRGGRVIFKSAPGPYGFRAQDVEDTLGRIFNSPRSGRRDSAPAPPPSSL